MPTITGNFPVRDGAGVHLRVSIGEGRSGRSVAALAGRELASGAAIDQALGEGGELRGGALVVDSVVEAGRAETQWTSATVQLVSGTTAREFTQRQQAASGKAVRYVFVITFGGAEDV